MDKPNTENVMALAFELAETRQRFGPQHPDYRAQVIALRAEVDKLAAQAAPSEAQADLVIAVHTLASHFENTLYALRDDAEAVTKAKGDIAHALQISAKYNRNGAAAQPSQAPVVQAGEYPPLPEGVKARFKCEDCDGTGYTGEMIPGSEFQPPEPVGCTSCNFTGWWAECEAYSADQMHAYLDADRASTVAALKARAAELEDFIVGIGQDLHHERVADWYPEGANNAALAMSESMRLIGNRCVDFDAALKKGQS